MPTADDILGKPTAEDILGPAPLAAQQELRASPPQYEGFWRYPLLLGSALGRGALTTLEIPGDIERMLMERGINPLVNYFGGTPEDLNRPTDATFFPTSAQTREIGGQLGLYRADLAAGQGKWPILERGLEAIGAGIGGGLPIALTGVAEAFLPTMAASVAGAGAGEAAQALGLPPEAQIGAGVAAGTGAAGITSLLRGAMLPRLQAQLGKATSWQSAGAEVRGAAKAWMDETLPETERTVWNSVDQVMKGKPVGLDSTEQELTNILQLKSSDPRVTALAKKAGGGAANDLWNTLVDPVTGKIAPMDWTAVRNLRSKIGEGMKDPILRGIGEQNLRRIYRSLTDDLGATAATQGADDLFSAANAESTRLRTLAEEHIGKIANAPTDAAAMTEAMRGSGIRGGGERLAALQANIPEAMRDVTAGLLDNGGREWAKLSAEARASLVPDPLMRHRIDIAVAAGGAPINPLKELAHLFVGGSAGAALGVLSSPYMPWAQGQEGALMGGATGELIGLALPYARRGLGAIARQPSMLRYPVAGGAGAAANALAPVSQNGAGERTLP